MYRLTNNGTKLIMRAIADGLLSLGTIGGTMNIVRRKLDADSEMMDALNVRDRHRVLDAAEGIVRKSLLEKKGYEVGEFLAKNLEPVLHAFNQIELKNQKRTARKKVVSKMREKREAQSVFYLVSSHQNPAEGHRPLQGTILVDAYWRDALQEHPRLFRMVELYIKEHNTLSVQKAMDAPYYLITRPNCKHRLIPIPIEVACMMGEASLRKMYDLGEKKRPLTYKQRRNELQALKNYIIAYASAKQHKGKPAYIFG